MLRSGGHMPDDKRPLSQAEIDALLQALSTNPPSDDPVPVTEAEAEPHDQHENLNTRASQEEIHSKEAAARGQHDDPRLRRTLHLPVTMFVSLGQKNLPIHTLLNWGIGTQIVLNREWQRAVSIKINGLEVGEGRVVLVGNNFGVEVTRWGKNQ